MYLCDSDIKAKLDQINFETTSPRIDFDPDEQIQPCSVDLRLSPILWEPQKKVGVIDLRKSALLELEPRGYWNKRILRSDECITLNPGQLLLGRTYEKFSIPTDCAGKIEGRSSFSRMGIGIHVSGDFINPGYRGHMTLQLYNYSPNPIRIFPYIPICQLIFLKLTGIPQHIYGDKEVQSTYMDDDGGPSYWWKDKRIKYLQETFRRNNVDLEVQEQLLNKIGIQEPEIIERFEKLLPKLSSRDQENVDVLQQAFAKSEDRLKTKDRIISGVNFSVMPILLSASIASLFTLPFSLWHYVLWLITLLSIYPFYRSFTSPDKTYLDSNELKKLMK